MLRRTSRIATAGSLRAMLFGQGSIPRGGLCRRRLEGDDLFVRPSQKPAANRRGDVKSSDIGKGFTVLPKRWIVERTIAWLNRCRRMAKDWECVNRKALAFLRLASTRLMLRKLCLTYL